MSYTLADIRNKVLDDKLDDLTFGSNIVDDFINDTQRDIFNTYELPFMEKNISLPITTGNRIFNMPTDLQLLQAITITSPDGKQKDIMSGFIDFRTFVKEFPTPANNNKSEIRYWTSYAGKIYTSAPLDTDYILDLFYIKTPDTLEDNSDIPEIPESFSEILVLGAFKRVLQRNEDFDLASVIDGEYKQQLDKMVSRYGFRLSSGPIKMKTPNRGEVRRS